MEFVSSPAGPLLNTGFHFNVGNWPGHVDTAGTRTGVCDWMLSSDALKDSNASEGIFLSIAHWYPPNTTCSYHIQGNEGEVVRLYFPRFVPTTKLKQKVKQSTYTLDPYVVITIKCPLEVEKKTKKDARSSTLCNYTCSTRKEEKCFFPTTKAMQIWREENQTRVSEGRCLGG